MIQKTLSDIVTSLEKQSVDRHEDTLKRIADWISKKEEKGERVRLNFICTHNSRRSQFAQAWCMAIQAYFNLDVVNAFSGGTEVTACNERTVAALSRAGFSIDKAGDENPVYTLTDKALDLHIELWSKVYDDEKNPSDNFAAVMTCDHADANCPFIPGAEVRIPLTYTDPKYSDGTDEEKEAYDRTCNIIATDMIRLFKKIIDV